MRGRARPGRAADLSIGDRRDRTVQFRQLHCELLIVGMGEVAQIAQRHRFAQLDRGIAVTAPMDAGMNAVTKAYIVRQLVQLAIDRQLSGIAASVIVECCSIGRWHFRVRDDKVAVEKELERGDASAGYGTVASGIGGVCRRPFGKCLRQEIAVIGCKAGFAPLASSTRSG
jgi:hypothetical protein